MTAPTSQKPSRTLGHHLRDIRDRMSAYPGLDYFMLRVAIFSLIGIGVVMAFSSSMATSLSESASPWSAALRQCLLVAAGLFIFWIALRISPRTLRACVPWFLGLSVLLLILVLVPGVGTGRAEVGSQSWIMLPGGVAFQPSEFARVAVGMYGASALADKTHRSLKLTDPFMMYSIISAIMFLLIMAQGDLGMAVSIALIVVFTLVFAGVDWRVPVVVGVAGVIGMTTVFLAGGFRSHRFHTYFDALRGNIADTQGTGFQAYQGFLSLADGGFWGVGLGQSRAKWFYLPEAKNDFVFAIIGEELGLWGGALVIILFAVLGYFGLRAAKRAQNQFQSLLAATLAVGVVVQAFINIGYVIGMLPVTGIQLPMISAGGTAAIITIGSMGLLCNVARHEPLQVSAMQNYGRPMFDRLFFVPEPTPPNERRGGAHRAPSDRRTSRGGGASKQRTQRVQGDQRSYRDRERSREERFGRAVTGRADSGRAGRDRRRGERR
ncbi:putative peptidoglycan glycosyltransferase FtsW [uncultured Corynebacterium sp.]|uniref:FtsW/RodA/SpoVE family cell cycle protein n=1 Tax=Corynebacterium sp. YSMAA5_1_F9 TaxID=3383591 RepID=UPI0025FC5716|nr:putative peptidoglycan glycosyltransferase FtsW [uncultured Corynebacterium sp.]